MMTTRSIGRRPSSPAGAGTGWHFARVRYREIYDGVDLVVYGNEGRLEHDFVLAPGADPARIRIRLDGAQSLEIGEDGALAAHVAGGSVRFEPPMAW